MWAAVTEAVEEHSAAYLHHPEASHQRADGESALTNAMQMDWLDDRVVNQTQLCQAQPLIQIIHSNHITAFSSPECFCFVVFKTKNA